jgi:glycosyl transferase family 2
MRVYGVMVAQNEGDVISETLEALRRLELFETIFFFDLGSEDDTLARAERFPDLLHDPRRLDEVYHSGLRFDLLARHRDRFRDGDWLAIVDADEIYAEDPRSLIELAELEQATCISTYQAEFMLTDADLARIADENAALPIARRRQYYLIQWSEERFYKFLPSGLVSNATLCSRKILNRHYQYRSPVQIGTRIRTRLANRVKAQHLANPSRWPQIFSPRWQDYIVCHRVLHRDDGGPLRFGLPEGIQWKDYYSKNPFGAMFPQVATALLHHRSGSSDVSDRAPGLFRDDYRRHVIQEFGMNMRARQWKETARSAGVLLRYLARWSRSTLAPVLGFGLRRGIEDLMARLLRLKRRLAGKSHGSIGAAPNPIARPHLSWQGSTTIRWSATAEDIEVRVGSPDGRLLTKAGRTGTITTGPWVEDSTVFYLQDVSDGKPLAREHTLGKVTVGLFRGPYVNTG